MPGLEEPEEHMGIRVQINVTRIAVYARRGLAHPILSRLFIANGSSARRRDSRDACRVGGVLSRRDPGCGSEPDRQRHYEDRSEMHHVLDFP